MSSRPLRSLLQTIIEPVDQEVVVATSSGIDSHSVVMSAVDCGKTVTVTSFTLDDRRSTDFKHAQRLAKHLSLEFVPVIIPTDPLRLLEDACDIIRTHLTSRKVTIECVVPFLYLFQELPESATLLTGLGADSHFGLGKKAMMHYRYPIEKLQEYKAAYYSDPTRQGGHLPELGVFAERRQIKLVHPYMDSSIRDLWWGSTWDELNKPRQKEVIRREFPEVEENVRLHTPLQLGDSGLAQFIGECVRSQVTPEAKSPRSAYNHLLRLAKQDRL